GPEPALLRVDEALTRRFLLDYPRDAAHRVERLASAEVAAVLARQPVYVLLPLWKYLVPQAAAEILVALPETLAHQLLAELPPQDAVRMLGQLDEAPRHHLLDPLNESLRRELLTLMHYPENSAGRLMDTRTLLFRADMTVAQVLDTLRSEERRVGKGGRARGSPDDYEDKGK